MPDKPEATPASGAGPADKNPTPDEITEIEARSFEPMYRNASNDGETEEIPEADKRASDDAQDDHADAGG